MKVCLRRLALIVLAMISLHGYSESGPVSDPVADSSADVTTAAIPYKPDANPNLPSVGNLSLLLIVIVAIVFVVSLVLKKGMLSMGRLPQASGEHIRIIDRQSLHGGHHVYLLEVDGRQVLSHVGPQVNHMVVLPGRTSACLPEQA